MYGSLGKPVPGHTGPGASTAPTFEQAQAAVVHKAMHGSIGCHMAVHDRKVKEIKFLLQKFQICEAHYKGVQGSQVGVTSID